MNNAKLPFSSWVASEGRNQTMWVDEAIWGHRFRKDQSLWHILLEFLNVFASEKQLKPATTEGLSYKIAKRLVLRNILFNNPHIEHIRTDNVPNEEAWIQWAHDMEVHGYHIDVGQLGYLKGRFFGDFEAFAETVELLRETGIDAKGQKRWTSRFLFPHGPDCLFADFGLKDGAINKDRRFFARGGELLYLMLARSKYNAQLSEAINGILLRRDAKWNKVASALTPPGFDWDKDCEPLDIGYLPYAYLSEYDQLAEDWLQVLNLRMPAADILHHLLNVSGINLLIYFIRRGLETISSDASAPAHPHRFVLEIAAQHNNRIRSLSAECLTANHSISARAVEGYIRSIMTTPQWQQAKESANPAEAAKQILSGAPFYWKPNSEAMDLMVSTTSADRVLEIFIEQARKRHVDNTAPLASICSTQTGFVTAHGSLRRRYAPSDSLLKTLVFAVVKERLDFNEFLLKLYERYRMVIGEREAEKEGLLNTADRVDFAENALRLERRLAAMGLLRKLSDACAYVINPFYQEGVQ